MTSLSLSGKCQSAFCLFYCAQRSSYSEEEVDLAREMVKNVFDAMQYDSVEARARLPRVLKVAEMDKSLQIDIIQHSVFLYIFVFWCCLNKHK